VVNLNAVVAVAVGDDEVAIGQECSVDVEVD